MFASSTISLHKSLSCGIVFRVEVSDILLTKLNILAAIYFILCKVSCKAVFTRATFGLFVARHRDWRRWPTVTRHPNCCRGGWQLKWNMSQCLLRSDTVIYEAATHCPVDELVLTFHLVYRHSSVCQLTAGLYLGHMRTPHH